MTKMNALRRFFLPCFSPSATLTSSSTTATTTKKRLSTSLRDDIVETTPSPDSDSETSPEYLSPRVSLAPPRVSRTMVIGTIFGHRVGPHIWFCTQTDRLSTKPVILLQLPLPTQLLVKEMQSGSVRITLQSHKNEYQWAACCNGRKLGFAVRRKPTEAHRAMLASLRSITVGAGVIPGGLVAGSGEGELMYMRANYECIVGGPDSESFHLISPDQCPGQELSIYLLKLR